MAEHGEPILPPIEAAGRNLKDAAVGIGGTVARWFRTAKEHTLNFINHITLTNFHWTAGWSIGAGVTGGLALLAGAEMYRRHRKKKRAQAAQAA